MTEALARPPSVWLTEARSVETLEVAYEAWEGLRSAEQALRQRFAAERARLDGQGAFLLGAVKAAGLSSASAPEAALAPQTFLDEAEQKLEAARATLSAREQRELADMAATLDEVRRLVQDRVRRFAPIARPQVRLYVRPLGKERAILHVERLVGDAPVLLHFLLGGAVPSRYSFLTDDAVEDLTSKPTAFYAEEGMGPEDIRLGPEALIARLDSEPPILPSKGRLFGWTPEPRQLFQLVTRGPVLEAELHDGAGYRNVLTRTEAERCAAAFVRLRLEGRIELDVKTE